MTKNLIEIKIDDSELNALLSTVRRKFSDLTPLTADVSVRMLSAVHENFEKEGRPPWDSLAESTKEQRRKKGHANAPILNIHGSSGLLGSVQPDYSDNYASVGSNKVYAAIHQLGGMAGPGRSVEIPARPFLDLTEEDMQEIIDIITGYLSDV